MNLDVSQLGGSPGRGEVWKEYGGEAISKNRPTVGMPLAGLKGKMRGRKPVLKGLCMPKRMRLERNGDG